METPMSEFTLRDLAARVKERAQAGAETSYTRKLLDRGVAHCAKKLGEEAFEEAWAQGRAITFEQAVEYALERDVASSPGSK